jgi:hypothetical protein
MTDEQQPDLTGEQEREQEAASSGIETRAAVLEIDDDDATMQEVDGGDAEEDDDDAIEDGDDGTVDADV